jgi:hypothetical protein
MNELCLWRWRFTDEFGKRRVTSWRMTENTVREYAPAEVIAIQRSIRP